MKGRMVVLSSKYIRDRIYCILMTISNIVDPSYWECLIFYVEHTKLYVNIIKSSVRISEVLDQ